MADTPNDPTMRRAREEIVARLDALGVHTSEKDSAEDLVELLDAVEGFEEAVERGGGDLMVDEPLPGASKTIQPDDLRFVLPSRKAGEAVRNYIERIQRAESDTERRGE